MITRNKNKNVKKEVISESGLCSTDRTVRSHHGTPMTVQGWAIDKSQAFLDESSIKCLLCSPLTETSLSKVQTCPAGLVAEVKEEVNPEVEPRDKAKNNQGSFKTKHSSNQQNKKARKRPSKVLGRVSFACI